MMSPRTCANTASHWLKERLDSPDLLEQHLAALVRLDKRLEAVRARAGQVKLRTAPKGFAGMAKVICGQQLSTASAAAIWGRLSGLAGAQEPDSFLAIEEPILRGVGLSRGKVLAITAVAEAAIAGTLDFSAVESLAAEDAITHLTAIKGVGPWTAEIYLLFCVGHPDVFPAGDLALKKAARDGLGLGEMPSTRGLADLASLWSPHRGAAALLLWRYFHVLYDRAGVAA